MQSSKEMGLYNEDKILKSVETRLKDIYNIDMGDKRLRLNAVTFGDYTYDPEDWAAIKDAKINRDTIGRPYFGDFELTNDKDEIIDKKRVKFGVLPVNTKLDNYLVDGNFYSVPVQFRLKPGAYTRETGRGDFEVFHNVKNGLPMRTFIDPQSKLMSIKIKQATVPLYSVLNTLGASDKEISRSLGDEIYRSNVVKNTDKDVNKLYRSLFNAPVPNITDAKTAINDYFAKLETTPKVNESTIKYPASKVDPRYLLESSRKLIDTVRGTAEPDNRDDLAHKDVFSIDDIVDDSLERIRKTHKLDWMVKRKLIDKDDIQKIVNRNDVNSALKGIFTSSAISRFSDQTNPLANEVNHLTTTLLGEGGIGSPDLVTQDAKQLQPSHMGFLDAAHTPESFSAGVTLFLANDTKKKGRELTTKVINLKTGEYEWLTAEKYHGENVAYPGEFVVASGQWVPDDDEVICISSGHHTVKHPSTVRYMLASPDGLFDLTSNTVPFLQSNQANRLLTSSKMATQASPLAHPERPLIDVMVKGKSILDTVGDKYSVHADTAGVVTDIGADYITVSSPRGDIRHAMPHNLPLNSDAFLDAKPLVAIGDRVAKGQLLADTNTTVGGKLSTGVNLNVAYLPYKGLNYEDAVVISESAAKKLATEHLHRIHVPREAILDMKKYRAYSPYDIKDVDVDRYDDMGIIKPGTTVSGDDILAASMQKRTFSVADSLIQRLKKSAVDPIKANPVLWDRSMRGVVTDVQKVRNGHDIYVKTIEPVLPGDKLVGRHGNKATVSIILPDHLTPRTEAGEPIDVIMDSLSVHPRINLGQLLETAAGKVARATGEPYNMQNFDGTDHRTNILSLMNKHSVPEKENIFDPSTGKTIPSVFTGVQYIHKLKHQVENKISARGIDEPYNINQQPTRGKGTGGQSIDNLTANILLSYNARNVLKDSFAIKNNPNREYWRAVQHGEIPPAPTAPYEHGKFEAMLKGMGVNTEHIGSKVRLAPLTDEMVRELSAGEVKEPYKTFRLMGDDIGPDKRGLFGEDVGGISGNVFNHMELPVRIAAPAYKDAIKAVLNITDKEYDKMLEE